MTAHALASPQDLGRLAAFAAAGLALGMASLALLRRNVSDYLAGGLWRSLASHLLRLAVLAVVLVWAARQGPGPLLAMAGGLVLARPLGVRVWGRAP